MKKMKYLIESKDFYEKLEDNFLSLIEDGFLELDSKPKITNDYGESGNEFNPTLRVRYRIIIDKIESISELERYSNIIRSLLVSLKRSNCQFTIEDRLLEIHFDMPDNLKKLLEDIKNIKKDKKYDGYTFVYKISNPVKVENTNFELSFKVDDNFDIFIDVKGLSWGDIGRLNQSKELSKILIQEFKEKYNIKYLSTYTEDRGLDPHGKVVHWKFQV